MYLLFAFSGQEVCAQGPDGAARAVVARRRPRRQEGWRRRISAARSVAYMRNLLGWLETRLAQATLDYLKQV